ncbi:MAG: signal peptide peptidase SppA, partial [Bacteroidales bacterium]
MMAIVNGIWNRITAAVSGSRNIPVDELNLIADGLLIKTPEDAVKFRMVDALKYKDEILDELRRKLGIGSEDDIETVGIAAYTHAKDPSDERPDRSNRIAVVYALGEIISGEGSDQVIGSERISKAIRKARLDDRVKAIVLRVNSPGGSALASEVILREAILASQQKPFVVSMGDVAASGGYYISCAADRIFADPTTITGSIGVLGMIPNLQKTMNENLGITFDYATTNENSNFMTPFRPLTEYQRSVVKAYIEEIYDTFVNHVAEGRDMTYEQVDAIAQGRVWIGSDALDINLIDQFGGLSQAIDAAAELAELESYTIKELPVQKDPFQEIVNKLFGQTSIEAQIRNELGHNYRLYQYLKYWQNATGAQARMPFDIHIH